MPICVVKLVDTAQRALQRDLESLFPQAISGPKGRGISALHSRLYHVHVSAEDGTALSASQLCSKRLRRLRPGEDAVHQLPLHRSKYRLTRGRCDSCHASTTRTARPGKFGRDSKEVDAPRG